MLKKTMFLLPAMLLMLAGCAENAPAPQSKSLNVSAYEITQTDGVPLTDMTVQANEVRQVVTEPQTMMEEALATVAVPASEEATIATSTAEPRAVPLDSDL